MSQFGAAAGQEQTTFYPWCLSETEINGQQEQTLAEERRELEEQKRKLELEQREFVRRVEMEDRRLEQQKSLFEMKFRILEEELQKLASEKQQIAKQKEFFNRVSEYEEQNCISSGNVVKGELFFSGVENRQSLKKRYKDLIKIYHPDNIDGDNNTLQEINREYDHLSKIFV